MTTATVRRPRTPSRPKPPTRPRLNGNGNRQAIKWPGCPGREFFLNENARRAVRVLLNAYLTSRSPEVPQTKVLRASRSGAKTLAELFDGTDALGVLLVPGTRKHHWMLAPIPEAK